MNVYILLYVLAMIGVQVNSGTLDELSSKMDAILCKLQKLDRIEERVIALEGIVKNVTLTAEPVSKSADKEAPQDCFDILLKNPQSDSGVYRIVISEDALPVSVYCDMVTDGGGWLVFQRRRNGRVNFNRNWTEYENGFGRLEADFWLGNKKLAEITSQKQYEMRVDLEDITGRTGYAHYATFSVDGDNNYRLTADNYVGGVGDLLDDHNRMSFSTYDRDCACCFDAGNAGWWYHACYSVNLNQPYHSSKFIWYSLSRDKLKYADMKIRPSQNV